MILSEASSTTKSRTHRRALIPQPLAYEADVFLMSKVPHTAMTFNNQFGLMQEERKRVITFGHITPLTARNALAGLVGIASGVVKSIDSDFDLTPTIEART